MRRTILDNFEHFSRARLPVGGGEREHPGRCARTPSRPSFPAMGELAAVVPHEIAWQKALWDEDYARAYEAAREVLGGLNNTGLRGYRALWHYLRRKRRRAGGSGRRSPHSNCKPAYSSGRPKREAASGIPWLVALAPRRPRAYRRPRSGGQTTVMLQVERLEAQLLNSEPFTTAPSRLARRRFGKDCRSADPLNRRRCSLANT